MKTNPLLLVATGISVCAIGYLSAQQLKPATRPDAEDNTTWNASPNFTRDADGAYHSTGLKSFEGIEEPTQKFVVADGRTQRDDFTNITDQGSGIVRMTLRYNALWWDGDQGTNRKDRQRAEVKGLGPHQKDGETFEYGTTFRTDPDYKGGERFCHIFQIKSTDGDKGAPLVTLSLLDGNHNGSLECYSGRDGFKTVRRFTYMPGQWQTVRIIVRTSSKNDGELVASVNGDAFAGVKNVQMYRPQATDYRPKWGFYRGTTPDLHDDWIEHKDAIAKKLPTPTTDQ